MTMHDLIYQAIRSEVQRATALHPEWPADPIHATAIVAEESGEAIRAAVQLVYEDGELDELRTELIQTAATCVRALAHLTGGAK